MPEFTKARDEADEFHFAVTGRSDGVYAVLPYGELAGAGRRQQSEARFMCHVPDIRDIYQSAHR